MPPKNRIRADQLAFELGLAESREKARSLIMAGKIIGPDGLKVDKPGHFFLPGTPLSLLPGKCFVSRGAYKLLTILQNFQLDVTGFTCLDAGASTGGFSDCLLQRGAAKVYAVDVGKNQLHEKLRADDRVIGIEGVNLRHAPANLVPEKVDLVCGDLSFISLTLVLPACMAWLKSGGLVAALIKPQFELKPDEVGKGVVRQESSRRKAVAKVLNFCLEDLDLTLRGVMPAQIKGPKGNQEYMALFQEPGRD